MSSICWMRTMTKAAPPRPTLEHRIVCLPILSRMYFYFLLCLLRVQTKAYFGSEQKVSFASADGAAETGTRPQGDPRRNRRG